jgi:hypothetical protein
VNFGKDVDLENPLFRTRIGAQWTLVPWLKLSPWGRIRGPQYGVAAPTSVRDTMDLHEGYFELFPGQIEGIRRHRRQADAEFRRRPT